MLSLQLTSSTLCSCDSFVCALLQVCADYTFRQNKPQFMKMPPSMSISRIKSKCKQWLRLKVFGAGHHFLRFSFLIKCLFLRSNILNTIKICIHIICIWSDVSVKLNLGASCFIIFDIQLTVIRLLHAL